MNILILGCGEIGARAGDLLTAAGHTVLGVRRRPHPQSTATFTVVSGDISDPTLHVALASALPRVDAVLLSANPGVRRGGDNGLVQAAQAVTAHHPAARLVYTGTTSVYADAAGGGVDEDGAVDRGDPSTAALLAIEETVLAQADSLVLRATALVGPTRTHARGRVAAAAAAGEACVVKGDVERPFSWLHEDDLAELCVLALEGGLGRGVLNAAAPGRMTVRGYYELQARLAGVTATLVGDGAPTPARWIDTGRLQRLVPGRSWRGCDAVE